MKRFLASAAVLALTGVAFADVIASQNFDFGAAYPSNPTECFDQFAASGTLTNEGSFYNGVSPVAGAGMTFSTTWTNTRSTVSGPVDTGTESTSDFIGTNSFAGSNSPDVNSAGVAYGFANGQYNYEFNDGDGNLALAFDSVDLTNYTNVTVSLDYWVADTGFEADDSFSVVANGNTELLLGEIGLENANLIGDTGNTAEWNFLSFGVTGSSLDLVINVDTNSGSENVHIDNISIEGDLIPEPASMLLIGLGALGLIRRR